MHVPTSTHPKTKKQNTSTPHRRKPQTLIHTLSTVPQPEKTVCFFTSEEPLFRQISGQQVKDVATI